MKNILFIFLFCVSLVAISMVKDPLLNIQENFNKLENEMYYKKSDVRFIGCISELTELEEKKHNAILIYWISYGYYKLALYHDKNSPSKAEEYVEKSLEYLDKVDDKNSEHLALNSIVLGFYTKYLNVLQISTNAARVENNGQSALLLDESNLRAHLALGINDYYVPIAYGGKQKVEKYLLNAIKLNNKKDENPYSPSWGKDWAYYYLVSYYLDKKNKDMAISYYQKGVEVCPDSYFLKSLNEKIK